MIVQHNSSLPPNHGSIYLVRKGPNWREILILAIGALSDLQQFSCNMEIMCGQRVAFTVSIIWLPLDLCRKEQAMSLCAWSGSIYCPVSWSCVPKRAHNFDHIGLTPGPEWPPTILSTPDTPTADVGRSIMGEMAERQDNLVLTDIAYFYFFLLLKTQTYLLPDWKSLDLTISPTISFTTNNPRSGQQPTSGKRSHDFLSFS